MNSSGYEQNICGWLAHLVGSSMKCNDQNLGWNPGKALLEKLCLQAIHLQPQWDETSPTGGSDSERVWQPSPNQSASFLLIPQCGPSIFTTSFLFLATLPLCLSPSTQLFLPLWLFCLLPISLHFQVCLSSTEVPVFFSAESSLYECLLAEWPLLESIFYNFVHNFIQFDTLSWSKSHDSGIAQYNVKRSFFYSKCSTS